MTATETAGPRASGRPRPRLGDWRNADEVTALQDQVLPDALARAARSPFYRRRFGTRVPRTRADLADQPVTTKQDLRDGYPFDLLAVEPAELATYHESSGTAGTPTPSFYTERDWEDLAERFARKSVGILPTDTFLVRTPYALMLTGHLAHAAGRLCGATVVPADNRSLAMPCSRVVRVLHDLQVSLTWSVATECLLWAAAATRRGWDPRADFPGLRALFTGGEALSPLRRDRIGRLWGVPVVEEYGSTETGSLAGQCPVGNLHPWADRVLFEVRDPDTGTFAIEGRGRLVVTTLYREAMPLVRYDLEDTVEIRGEDCACGWGLPTIRVYGRAAFGHRVGNARVTQNDLEEAVFSLPDVHGVLFWRARAEPEHLDVEIEVEAAQREAACATLTAVVRERLGVDARVRGLPPGAIVPDEVLTTETDVVKPRSLFGAGEDWGKAVLYY